MKTFTGSFWVPGSDYTFQGSVVVDDDVITARFQGRGTGSGSDEWINEGDFVGTPVVHGTVDGDVERWPTEVTLFGVSSNVGESSGDWNYGPRISHMIVGGHLSDDQVYDDFFVRVRHLEQWASIRRFDWRDSEAGGWSLSRAPREEDYFDAGDYSLGMIARYSGYTVDPIHGGAMWQRSAFHFKGESTDILGFLHSRKHLAVSEFVTMMTQKDCPVVEIGVNHTTSQDVPPLLLRGGEPRTITSNKYLRIYGKGIHTEDLDYLQRGNLNGNMVAAYVEVGPETVCRWIKSHETLWGPSAALAKCLGTNSYKTTELFAMAASVDLLADKFADSKHPDYLRSSGVKNAVRRGLREANMPSQIDRVIKMMSGFKKLSYKDKLHRLASITSGVVPEATSIGCAAHHSVWLDKMSKFRHMNAHYNGKGEYEESIFIVIRSFEWLLTSILLSSAGMPDDKIRDHLLSYPDYVYYKNSESSPCKGLPGECKMGSTQPPEVWKTGFASAG